MALRSGRIARLRRWIANPIATVVLLGVLVTDALTLPKHWNPTTAGAIVRELLDGLILRARATDPNGIVTDAMYVVREPAGMRVVDPAFESWDELSAILSAGDPPVVECMARDTVSRSGVWSHTIERRFRGFDMRPIAGHWSTEDLASARAALFVRDNMSPGTWQELSAWTDVAATDQRSATVVWRGVAHDAFALVVFVVLLYSFTGWPAWFAARPWSRAGRRRSRGLCPACGYDLRTIEGGVCPECGVPLRSPAARARERV